MICQAAVVVILVTYMHQNQLAYHFYDIVSQSFMVRGIQNINCSVQDLNNTNRKLITASTDFARQVFDKIPKGRNQWFKDKVSKGSYKYPNKRLSF